MAKYLDAEMMDHLKGVFAVLETPLTFKVTSSDHTDQAQLLALLDDLQTTSSKISVEVLPTSSKTPRFWLEKGGKPTGISFTGIPGGHEFTSLVLALLHSDFKAKQPDAGILRRVRSLKGPIQLRTFVSLTCENCPDVVQALNQMAVLHGDFTHEMVDGAYVPEEIERLGIQGVPSVFVGDSLLHSGKMQFIDLLANLETKFGTRPGSESTVPETLGDFDVAVIGAGPAGASAAIYSARKGLKTALIAERFGGQVQDTLGIENLISIPYTEGPKLAANLQEHVRAYPVEIFEHRRLKTLKPGAPHELLLESGESLRARSVILATGAKWRELGIPGEKEYLGRGVAFCPHCDGPYYKGKKVAVVGGGNSGVEAAIDLAGIVRELVLIEFGAELRADKVLVDRLKALPNVSILTQARSTQVFGDGKKVHALEWENRETKTLHQLDLDGVFVQIGLIPNSQAVKGLLELSPSGEIVVDQKGRTSIAGIYAAGDVTTTPYKQIVIALGEGAKAALAAFEDRVSG